MSSVNRFDYDLFVIGGGSGGVRAARFASQRGARVGLAEGGELGGTCVNVGCIPKKLYSYAGHFATAFREAVGYGWQLESHSFDWNRLKRNRAAEIRRLNDVYRRLLEGASVASFPGWASLIDPHTVSVKTTHSVAAFTARNILIATGGTPYLPDIEGREHIITSDDIFDVDPYPDRLLVVGGGYIASEFASIFNDLGSSVVQLVRGEQILRGFDDDVRHFAAEEMKKKGVDLRTNSRVVSISRECDGLHVTLDDGNSIEVDSVLYATGRVPNVSTLNLQTVGVEQETNGAILVNDRYLTSVPSIYAVGDVTSRIQLTPVALAEAMVVVDNLFGPGSREMNYNYVPTAVFTHPSIGTVGLTESEARLKYDDIDVYRSEFRPLRHTLSGSNERTLMKLVVDKRSDRVVGLHMVGPEAGEIVQGFAVAMKAGATKSVFDNTVGVHPTAAEEFVTMREAVKGAAPLPVT